MSQNRIKFSLFLNVVFLLMNLFILVYSPVTTFVTYGCIVLHCILLYYFAGQLEDKEDNDEL